MNQTALNALFCFPNWDSGNTKSVSWNGSLSSLNLYKQLLDKLLLSSLKWLIEDVSADEVLVDGCGLEYSTEEVAVAVDSDELALAKLLLTSKWIVEDVSVDELLVDGGGSEDSTGEVAVAVNRDELTVVFFFHKLILSHIFKYYNIIEFTVMKTPSSHFT